jgi:hypothetical protein
MSMYVSLGAKPARLGMEMPDCSAVVLAVSCNVSLYIITTKFKVKYNNS